MKRLLLFIVTLSLYVGCSTQDRNCETTSCGEGATCEMRDGSPVCTCPEGLYYNGSICGTIDDLRGECYAPNCGEDIGCARTEDGYAYCDCPDGMVFTGFTCVSPAQCESISDEESCLAGSCRWIDVLSYTADDPLTPQCAEEYTQKCVAYTPALTINCNDGIAPISFCRTYPDGENVAYLTNAFCSGSVAGFTQCPNNGDLELGSVYCDQFCADERNQIFCGR